MTKNLSKSNKNRIILYNLTKLKNINYEKFVPILIQIMNSITRYNFFVKFILISDQFSKLKYLIDKYKNYLLEKKNISVFNNLNHISNKNSYIELYPTILWYENPILLLNKSNHQFQNIDNKYYYKIKINDNKDFEKYNCLDNLFPHSEKVFPEYSDICDNNDINVNNIIQNSIKSIFSFTIFLTTIGRDSLLHMLNSISNQLDYTDTFFICVDGKEYEQQFYKIFNKIRNNFTCKIVIKIHPENLGYWGHGLRNFYQSSLPGDFIWHIDDDDIILPNAINTIKKICVNKKYIYFFPIMYNFTHKLNFRLQQDYLGTPSGIIPNIKSHFGEWKYTFGGDFDFYWNTIKYIGVKNIRYIDISIYNVNNDSNINNVLDIDQNDKKIDKSTQVINTISSFNQNKQPFNYKSKDKKKNSSIIGKSLLILGLTFIGTNIIKKLKHKYTKKHNTKTKHTELDKKQNIESIKNIKYKNSLTIVMVFFCVNNTDYITLGINNINSLHNINSNRECHVYADTLCYNFFEQNKCKLNFPEKVKIIKFWDKIDFSWQWCYQILLKKIKYEFFICDADTIWNIDPFIPIENNSDNIFFLKNDYHCPNFKNFTNVLDTVPGFYKNIYKDFNINIESLLDYKILWNGILFIPQKLRSEQFINYLFKYTKILENGLPDNIIKSKRMFEQTAQALICQIFYPDKIFVIQDESSSKHIISLCYGSEGNIDDWYNLEKRENNLIERQQKLLNQQFKLQTYHLEKPIKINNKEIDHVINTQITNINMITIEDIINFEFMNDTFKKVNNRIVKCQEIEQTCDINNMIKQKNISNEDKLLIVDNIVKYNDLIKVTNKDKHNFLKLVSHVNKLEVMSNNLFSIFLISQNVEYKNISNINKFKNRNNLKLNIKNRDKNLVFNCKVSDLLILNGALNFLAEFYHRIIVQISLNNVPKELLFKSNIEFNDHILNFSNNDYINLIPDDEYKLNYSKKIHLNLDEYKYYQLGLNIDIKWKYFKYNKGIKDQNIQISLDNNYIFVEKEELYSSDNIEIITPHNDTNIFNYIDIIANAQEVHVTEGPFLDLIDLTNLCQPKKVYIHGKISTTLYDNYNFINNSIVKNIGLIIPFYHCYNKQRFEVCDKVFHHYSKVRESLKKNNINLIVICIGSENTISKKITEKYNHIYLEFDQHNTDLVTNRKLINVKYNIGYKYLSSYNCSYYISVGSDDLFTEGIFKSMINGEYFDLGFPGKFLKHRNDGGWNMIDISNNRSVKILKYLLDKDDVDYCLSDRKDIYDKPKGAVQGRNKLSLDSIGGCVIVSDNYARELLYEPHTMANESLTFMHAHKNKKKIKLFRMGKDQYEYWNIKTEAVSNTFENIIKYFDYEEIDNKKFLDYYYSL
jgi:hypothetical protein